MATCLLICNSLCQLTVLHTIGPALGMSAPKEAMFIGDASEFTHGTLLAFESRDCTQAIPLVIDVECAAGSTIPSETERLVR